MANPEHVKWLLEGAETWNARYWEQRKNNLGFKPDFSETDLWDVFRNSGRLDDNTGPDLSDFTLQYANFQNARIGSATLNGSNLHRADFRSASIYDSKMINTDLYGADFRGARIWLTDFTGAKLRDAKLKRRNICRMCFR